MPDIFLSFLDIGYTNNGTQCKNKCQFYGDSENWCSTGAGEYDWDFCTPTGKFSLETFYTKNKQY